MLFFISHSYNQSVFTLVCKYNLYKIWKLFDYKDTKESLAKEMESRQVSDQRRKKIEVENEARKQEVESLESSIQKVPIQKFYILEVRKSL